MGKGYLDTPRHAASYSVAYPQGRPWSVRARSLVVQLLLAGLAVWAAAATAAAALGATWHALAPAAGYETHGAAATKYVLVIDSGSSGTRMYAHNWTLPAGQEDGAAGSTLPVVQSIPPSAAAHLVPKKEKKGLYNRVETQPGLDAFFGHSADLASVAIEPLLAWARAVVPSGQHAATPLFLLGTGGLRRLDVHARAALMADIRQLLAGSGFRFHDVWARVISGTEEGMYGWLALNYEQGLLQQQLAAPLDQPTAAAAAAIGATPVTLGILGAATSIGALDLGGSSLEMTHEVLPGSSNSTRQAAGLPLGMQNVTVAGHTFHLHTHTFRRYGLNEAFDRSVTLLLEQQEQQMQEERQQQQSQQAAKSEQQLEPPQTTAAAASPAAAGTDADNSSSVAVAPAAEPNLPADAALAHQAQVDLAVAAAAGLKPHTPSVVALPAVNESGSQASIISSGSSGAAAAAEHQAQADLAVAAAAGLHPKTPDAAPLADVPYKDAADSASAPQSLPRSSSSGSSNSSSTEDVLRQHHIQADLAVAATAGLRPQHSDSSSNASAVASSSSNQQPAVDPPGTNAVQLNTAIDPVSSAGSSSSLARASDSQHERLAVGLQAPTGTGSSSMQPGVPEQQQEHRALQARDRRQQQRRQRQLLLQQHKYLEPDEVMDWADGLNSDLEVAVAPLTSSTGSSSSDQPAAVHCCSSGGHGLAEASGLVYLQGLLRRLLLHSSATVAAPGASRKDELTLAPQPDSSGSAEPSSSTTNSGSVAPAPLVSAPLASSNASHLTAAGSIHPPQSTGDAAVSATVSQAPAEPGAAAGVHAPEVWHPCLHEGFSAKYDRLAYDGTAPSPAQVVLRGRPSWLECLALVDAVVNASAPCQVSTSRPACRLGSAQPEHKGSFLALTGFYVVAKFLQVPHDAPLGAVLDASKELCSRPWSWVSEHLGHNINVERYCTWGPYVVKLLRHGLQLKDSAVRVGSGDVGWPLGAALAEASKLPDMMGLAGSVAHTKAAKSRKEQAAWADGAAASAAQKHVSSSSSSDHSADQQRPASSAAQVAGTTGTSAADGQASVAAPTTAAGAGSNAAVDDDGSDHVGTWQYSQRRSWAQALWGSSRQGVHMAHVCVVFMCVVIWLSVVVYCLSARVGAVGLSVLPVMLRGLQGPGKARYVLPVAAHPAHHGRARPMSSPSPGKTSGKYMGI